MALSVLSSRYGTLMWSGTSLPQKPAIDHLPLVAQKVVSERGSLLRRRHGALAEHKR